MECNFAQEPSTVSDTKITKRKVGRPRKSDTKSSKIEDVIPEKKTPLIPTKAADGLYWCTTCHKHFQKPRQFSVHVCLSPENQDEDIDDLEEDSDVTADFKISMHVHKYPWSRRKKMKVDKKATQNSEPIEGDEENSQEQALRPVPNWRDDPLYVPLFNSESEKEAFEKHLKTIDYSCVDVLFDKLETKSKSQFNKKRKLDSTAKYSCITCKKDFKSLCHVRMHCLTHTDLKPFTCPKCSYSCNVKAGLYTHMRTHTGNLFQCSQCNFQTAKRSHLLDHEQTHSTVLICCELCKNMFKNLKSLIFHVKKYHANVSGKRFIKSLHSKQLNKCDICGRAFASNSSLKSHLKYFHSKNNNNVEQINNQNISVRESENLINNINQSDRQILSESGILINESPEVALSEKLSESENNDSCTSFKNLVCANTASRATTAALDSQNHFENFATSDLTDTQKSPLLLDCSVTLEPLDNQILVHYHKYTNKCAVCNQSFFSKEALDNHEILDHSSSIRPEQIKTQELNQKISENTLENINFADTPALLKCSVRIEPLDNQLLVLNNLLQQKSSQNVNIFENVFQGSENQNILNSNTLLNETVSVSSTQEKLIPNNNELYNSETVLEDLEILDHSSNVSTKDLQSQEVNPDISENVFEDISFTDTPALSSLLKCSVRIEPLDDQLVVRLMLNDLLQQNSAQNLELLDNVFHQPQSENILNSKTINENVSVSNTPEKLISINNESIVSSKTILESQEILDNSSNLSSEQLGTLENPENSFKNLTFTDTPASSSLLNCSVRIEPLDDQLMGLLNNESIASPKTILESHKILNNSSNLRSEQLQTQENLKIPENSFETLTFTDTPALSSLSNCSVRIEPLDDQLMGLLNNLLQQKNDQNVEIFDNVFQQSKSQNILHSNTVLNETLSTSTPERLLNINNVDQFHLVNTSMLDRCHNKLDIIDECMRQSDLAAASYQTADSHLAKQQSSTFELSGMSLDFSDNQLVLQSMSENTSGLSKTALQEDSEQKSEETKLFEKCRQAPAYVCCVCSSIFICTSTLKAHLKEHVNKNHNETSFVEYPVDDLKSEELPTNASTINNVCSILPESSNSDVENELEKLYTSSLHKRWYLPEVSVVIENDQSLMDSFLEDFSMNDKFDDQENLQLESVIF